MNQENTNWGQSVTGVLFREGKVLLARHTYGSGNGMLIVPGGYVNEGESPQEAVKREYLEETGVMVEPGEIVGIRFNRHDWYVAFRVDYVGGEARSDQEENSEVLWLDIDEALARADVPDLTKKLILSAKKECPGLARTDYESRNEKKRPCSYYGL